MRSRAGLPAAGLLTFAVLSVPAGALALAAGCGSSNSTQASGTDASGDVSTPDAVVSDVVDAGPDIDQPYSVYPSKHQPIPQIDYNGGPILQDPRIVTITFTGDPHREGFRALDHNIAGNLAGGAQPTDWWTETAEGYCISEAGPCVGAGTTSAPDGAAWLPEGSTEDAGDGYLDVELPYDFASNTVDDSQIPAWLDKHITAGDFPAPDSQTTYVIYFPTTSTITDQDGVSCIAFGGYHTAGMAGGQLSSYAVIPYCDYGQGDTLNYTQVQVTASHEIAEATTDPYPLQKPAFYLTSNDAWEGAQSLGGGECGDMCEGLPSANWPDNGYTFQRIWSNQAAASSEQPCQPWPNVYFAAAVRTTPIDVGNGRMSSGYVVAKRGQDTTVIADVFSQQALPHDVQLVAGKTKGVKTTTPQDVGVPDDGITVTLSKNQALHNGNGVYVTFTVPSNAQIGDVKGIVVRAILDSDYNDWPVIVRVQ